MFIKRLPTFEHHAPATIAAALDVLSRSGGKARFMAGGTDLLPALKRRELTLDHVISLKGIAELREIAADECGLRIGALVTLGEIERSDIIGRQAPILRQAVQLMAAPQIRTLATIGGNICSAVPSADSVPPLIALQASVRLQSAGGERSVPLEDFFRGPKESVLQAHEIMTEIVIPRLPVYSGGAYIKLMRRSVMELALVGVAAQISLDASLKMCAEARIALGAVAPTPLRATEAEAALVGRELSEATAKEVGKAAATACRPRSNSIRASVEYRRSMVEVLTKRAILEALQSAKEKM